MGKKSCKYCGKELDDKSSFCTGCGAKIDESKEIIQEDKPNKNGKTVAIVSIIVVVVIALIVFLVWFFAIRDDGKSDKEKALEKIVNDVQNEINKEQKEIKDKIDDVKEKHKQEETKKEDEKLNGYLYLLNDNYGWAKDNKFYYLVDKRGNVINKVKYSYYSEEPMFYDGYSQILNTIYNTKGDKVLSTDDGYQEIKYTQKGYVVVEIKEEDYKGKTIKKGIYDLNSKSYLYEPEEGINIIEYLDEGMFLIRPTSISNEVKVFNSETKKSFSIGDRFDVLLGTYRDGYIVYRDINSSEVYLLDKDGTKKLIYNGEKRVQLGQYSDGLVYIKDAFYDINGNKVIDLRDEGVRGTPEFVNGNALVYFNTGYFTILNKDTKEYAFTPKKYTELAKYYNDDFEFGILEKQNKLSKDGYLIVKVNDGKKTWAIMDSKGKIVYRLDEGVKLFGSISSSGYISVDGLDEDYFITVNGKKVEIKL